MLRKAFAGLLVILTVLPFTAPFPVCDFAHTSPASTGAVDNGSHGLPTVAASGRMRTRFISHVDANVGPHDVAAPAAYVAPSVPVSPRLPDRTSSTVLRI